MQWRLVGDVETLRRKPCWRLRSVSPSSPSRRRLESSMQPTYGLGYLQTSLVLTFTHSTASWRLRCVSSSSPSRRLQSNSTLPIDLVLVYVSKLDQFFALDGICAHVGTSDGFTKLRSQKLQNSHLTDCHFPSVVGL